MKRYLIIFLLTFYTINAPAQGELQKIDASTVSKYSALKNSPISSVLELTKRITTTSASKKEQLQLFLLWMHDNMNIDSVRLFQGGNPLSDDEAFAQRIGLCDEYSNITTAFCQLANIPVYKVAGYVKYPTFKPGDKFTEANHAWNAVFIDSSWLLCDLFWSTAALTDDFGTKPHFIKRVDIDYFLAEPSEIINDHLPADPVFQFSTQPIAIDAFTSKREGIDTSIPKMKYLNYQDSLVMLSKLNSVDQELRIAHHIYDYNKQNPDALIAVSYNTGVDLVNKTKATKEELIKARLLFNTILQLIDTSSNPDIRSLKPFCKTGFYNAEHRLAAICPKCFPMK